MSSEPEYLPPRRAAGTPPPLDDSTPSGMVEGLSLPQTQYRDLSTLQPGERLYTNVQDAKAYAKKAKAKSTNRAYDSDWRHFSAWCASQNLCPLPALPATVILYITELASPTDGSEGRAPATIGRRITTINTFHKKAELESPALMKQQWQLSDTYQGIRRDLGTAQTMKRPITKEEVMKILEHLEGPPLAVNRNRALVLIGFVCALRRSELVGVCVEHVKEHKKGMTITIPKSKTDQTSEGRKVEILWGIHDDTCPALALRNWLSATGITVGSVFRAVNRHGNVSKRGLSSDSIGRIIQKLVDQAGIEHPKEYGGHSLRAGFVTEASANGASDPVIMKQTGHKTTKMVRRYSRGDQQDKQLAVSKLGL